MTYAERVAELEAEGLTTSDAQGVADAEQLQGRAFDFDPAHPLDSAPTPRRISAERCQQHGAVVLPCPLCERTVRLTAAQTAAARARVHETAAPKGFCYWTKGGFVGNYATRAEAEAASIKEWRDNLG